MFFVNYRSQNTRTIPMHLIINTLKLSPQERSLADHEMIYRFLDDNPVLTEIQRTKSLYARLQTVASVTLLQSCPSEDDSEKMIAKVKVLDENANQEIKKKQQALALLNKDKKKQQKLENVNKYTSYYIVISKQKYIDIMASTKEKDLRQKIEILKRYTLLRQMSYQQLLHLSYYLEKVVFKYKDYVYREGSNPDYVYLVEQGEFHYIKQLTEATNSQQHKKIKKNAPKRYAMMVQNPNKVKNSRSISYQVGIIQGGCGQGFGDEEIVSQKKREYSVKCMSTQNLIYRVKKQYYLNVVRGTKTQMDWLKSQKQKKLDFKRSMLQNILTTKNNYTQYLHVISENADNVGHHHDFEPQVRISPQNKEIKSHGKSIFLKQKEFQFQNNSLQGIIAKTQNYQSQGQTKFLKSQQSEASNDLFELTKPYDDSSRSRDNSIYKTPSQSIKDHLRTPQNSRNQLNLPLITRKQQLITQKNYESIDESKVKSWSSTQPGVQLKQMRSKYTKMIDSNALIREKEYILERRKTKQSRKQIFPHEQPKRKLKHLRQFQQQHNNNSKAELRQMRSAAHSKIFMQKLLVQALKKAGYNTSKEVPKSDYPSDKDDSIYDIKVNMRIAAKKKQKEEHLKKSNSLLEDNPFDQYYFRKAM